LPGGHRARGMRDYLESEILQRHVTGFFEANKPVAAICHGVLLAARSISKRTGRSVLHGYRTTALTWAFENSAWSVARITRFWDPNYYRTYLEQAGQPKGFMSVQQEVTRALALPIEYAQADILALGGLGRSFDVIEASGSLQCLADPAAGWRVLLSLLRPHGLMLVGLYSAAARQSLAAARALNAERGYRATAEDIRACRQELIQRFGMPPFRDFSSTSGCRDLLFNVMEHQFTIPQIKAFLDANHLMFLGFEQLPPAVLRQFQQQLPDADAMHDLGSWHVFEQMNPLTFGNMYFLWVQRREPS